MLFNVHIRKLRTILTRFQTVGNQYHLSQAAACDGTRITTTTNEQEAVPGTLPTF